MKTYKPFCKHCNSLLTQDSAQVSEDYQFACLVCDEDFCAFEVKFKEQA